jgi:omega-6 fatty acid desaturase (delta-12 desaturase)
VRQYTQPITSTSVRQLVGNFLAFFGFWALAYVGLSYSYWVSLPFIVLAAGFVVRIFIIQHDCGHGSFFKSQKLNNRVGAFCGVFTLTPYYAWRKSHALHHAHTGDLDLRGHGDIYTMTVDEYLQSPWWKQLGYRIYRNPFVLFLIAPMFLFVVSYRIPWIVSASRKKERQSVWWTNFWIAVVLLLAWQTIGLRDFFIIQGTLTFIMTTVGVWLFYVQHQFEDTYWEEHENWVYALAAMKGSSYYKLPRWLQWFTGNIGFHHIHHLNPKIPNYRLEEVHESDEVFRRIPEITIWASLKSIPLRLWDDKREVLISFASLKQMLKSGEITPTRS